MSLYLLVSALLLMSALSVLAALVLGRIFAACGEEPPPPCALDDLDEVYESTPRLVRSHGRGVSTRIRD